MDELTIIAGIILGAILTYVVIQSRRKKWYLETMNPRQHYELGKEKKLIVNMTINKQQFNGFEAGKYKILLLHGDLAIFSKPILRGKIEEMYMAILAESLMKRRLVTRIEKLRFFDFIFRRIPALSPKAYMVTGELISPQDVLDYYWKGDERDKALTEMRKRHLINPKVLWVKPYPPEDKLKEIMTGALMIPDIIIQHEKQYAMLTATQRETLIKMDTGIAVTLREVIQLQRDIVTSISDPVQVLAMLISDRAKKIEGLGVEQLAEKGGMPSIIRAAKIIQTHRNDLLKALGEKLKPEEIAKIETFMKTVTNINKRLKELETRLPAKTKAVAAT